MTVLDRVPVEAITARAADVDVARLLLSLLALPFILIGWTVRAVFVALAWMWAAVLIGWQSGPGTVAAKDG